MQFFNEHQTLLDGMPAIGSPLWISIVLVVLLVGLTFFIYHHFAVHHRLKTDYANLQNQMQRDNAVNFFRSDGIPHDLIDPINFIKNFSKASQSLAVEMEFYLHKQQSNLSEEDRIAMENLIQDMDCNMSSIYSNSERIQNTLKSLAPDVKYPQKEAS